MENNQQETPEQKPAQPNIPPSSQERKDSNDTEENSSAKAQTSDYPKYEAPTIIVNNIQKDKLTIANIISIASVLVSGALFYYTYCLFKQAQVQSIAATKAATYAGSAVSEYKAANKTADNNYQLAKKVADSSDSIAARNYRLQSKSISAQIKSLKDANNELGKENRPLVQLADVRLSDSVIDGRKIKIVYNVIDLGKFPAKVLSVKANVGTDTVDNIPLIKYLIDKAPEKQVNHFTFGINYIPQSIASSATLNKYDCDKLTSGKGFIYFFGQIKYSGILDKRIFTTRFIYKITTNPGLDISAIENKDSVIQRK